MIGPNAGIADGSFVAGTRVAVQRADLGATECPVEELAEGDLVLTRSGQGATCKPVLRIGRRQVDVASHPNPALATPVRISADALAPGTPRHDLLLSQEALLLFPAPSADDPPFLVPAGALINGTNILRETQPGLLTWFTLELEEHDVILAENTPVASIRDSRRGSAEPRPRPPLCAPLMPPGPTLLALRARLNPASGVLRPQVLISPAEAFAPADDLPHLYVDDREISPESGTPDWEFCFLLPAESGPARLISASYPSPSVQDKRWFGVCVTALELDGTELPLNGEVPGPGFHPVEGDANSVWRWTNGNAWLLLPHCTTARSLTLRVTDWHRMLKPPSLP
jgi:hypothetical protein